MHLIHHHMMSVAACSALFLCRTQNIGKHGGDIMKTSLHHKWANGGENNKHLISIRFLSWHFLPHWIRSATNQKMIPCLLDTKKPLILLTWTQYKIQWYLSTLDLLFYVFPSLSGKNNNMHAQGPTYSKAKTIKFCSSSSRIGFDIIHFIEY